MSKKTIYLILFAMLFALSSFKKMPVIKVAAKIKTDSTVQSNKTIPQITFSEIARLSRNEISNLIWKNISILKRISLIEGIDASNQFTGCFCCICSSNSFDLYLNSFHYYVYLFNSGGFFASDDSQPVKIKFISDYNSYYFPSQKNLRF